MIENLKRYTMVIRRDRDGCAIPALKIRRKGDVCKFSELEEALRSASDNKAMFQFLSKIKKVLDSGSEYLIVPNFTIHKKLNAVLAKLKHS